MLRCNAEAPVGLRALTVHLQVAMQAARDTGLQNVGTYRSPGTSSLPQTQTRKLGVNTRRSFSTSARDDRVVMGGTMLERNLKQKRSPGAQFSKLRKIFPKFVLRFS